MKPLAIDLFCGLGGWTDGLLAEGYDVIGFDIERHRYPKRILPAEKDDGSKRMSGKDQHGNTLMNRALEQVHGVHRAPIIAGEWVEYPGILCIQDVLTLHGSQFKNATLIVASPPCQEYSYMAMPWSKAKAKAAEYRSGARDVKQLTALFDACFRIQREACEAAGRHIPLVVENVRGAIPWVGPSRWNFGSFHLWGDVPALMPATVKAAKVPGFRFDGSGRSFQSASVDGIKGAGPKWDAVNGCGAHGMKRWTNPAEGIKCGGDWFNDSQPSISRLTSSKSPARKFASAMIAKIPLPLSRHIGATFKPPAHQLGT